MTGAEPNREPNGPTQAAHFAHAVTELRRHAVEAVARQKRLECRRRAAAELADRLEELAVRALNEDRDRVRSILDQRVEVLKQEEALAEELQAATARAQRLKAGLLSPDPTSDDGPGGPV